MINIFFATNCRTCRLLTVQTAPKLQPKYLSEKRKVVNVPRMTEDLAIKRKKVTQTNEMICFSSFFIGDTKKPNKNKITPLCLMAEMKLKNFKLTRVFTHILQTGRGQKREKEKEGKITNRKKTEVGERERGTDKRQEKGESLLLTRSHNLYL